jgi:hypothetical protein
MIDAEFYTEINKKIGSQKDQIYNAKKELIALRKDLLQLNSENLKIEESWLDSLTILDKETGYDTPQKSERKSEIDADSRARQEENNRNIVNKNCQVTEGQEKISALVDGLQSLEDQKSKRRKNDAYELKTIGKFFSGPVKCF